MHSHVLPCFVLFLEPRNDLDPSASGWFTGGWFKPTGSGGNSLGSDKSAGHQFGDLTTVTLRAFGFRVI